jgi:hypothetical protein
MKTLLRARIAMSLIFDFFVLGRLTNKKNQLNINNDSLSLP